MLTTLEPFWWQRCRNSHCVVRPSHTPTSRAVSGIPAATRRCRSPSGPSSSSQIAFRSGYLLGPTSRTTSTCYARPERVVTPTAMALSTTQVHNNPFIGVRRVNPTGTSFRFVSCVRARARSGCLVEYEPKRGDRPFLFSLLPRRPFPFCPAELSLFPCV